jgi:hypothetical protein
MSSTARQPGLFETVEREVEEGYGDASALSGFVNLINRHLRLILKIVFMIPLNLLKRFASLRQGSKNNLILVFFFSF